MSSQNSKMVDASYPSAADVSAASRRPRADAARNRERLIEAASAAFATGDKEVSLEAIARDAGVGIGTLYRHFPTRDALVEVVHRDGLATVLARADELLATHDPAMALRLWMDDYAEFVTRKRGMAESLRSLSQAGVIAASDTHTRIAETVQKLLDAGAAAGTLRSDVQAQDVANTLVGVFLASPDLPRSWMGWSSVRSALAGTVGITSNGIEESGIFRFPLAFLLILL